MFSLFAVDPVEDIVNDSGKKIVTTIVVSAVTSLAAFLFGRYYGRYKARREWMSKEFFNRVIVSLNIFADGYLKIRTVMEDSIETVFLNRIAIDKVLDAAKASLPPPVALARSALTSRLWSRSRSSSLLQSSRSQASMDPKNQE